ncbi:LysR family transcriptional regulator [Rhizobium sp. KVB221]|uniref:HTH-type transcriptional regulator TtuA n=1 Tax=Rhizobium setariae TaxID=2801340 RepID=A0A937CPB8_9HYPH|nr:LysR family transcriptional regulator [Rhizobium setariae]MBL0372293.1 LysR family transcriptional regulator [Rhizobium setariae]
MESPQIKDLVYLLTLSEELHFGRAAERLGIAQPPLSRRIQQIEEDLGVQLFNRGRSSITLTQAGEAYSQRVAAILQDIDDARLEARRIGQGAEGRLRIGFVGSATYGVLPTILKSFRCDFPQISLSLTPMNNAGLRRALIRREIDIAIARPHIKDAEIISRPLMEERLILAVPDIHPLAERREARLDEVTNCPIILYPEAPRPSFADTVIDIFQYRGLDLSDRVFAMDFQTAISLVSVGEGVSIVPASVGEAERKTIRYIGIDDERATTRISLNFRIDAQSIHIRRFVDLALGAVRTSINK